MTCSMCLRRSFQPHCDGQPDDWPQSSARLTIILGRQVAGIPSESWLARTPCLIESYINLRIGVLVSLHVPPPPQKWFVPKCPYVSP
jgi:hypothetical protein